jgi:hypothetical protein
MDDECDLVTVLHGAVQRDRHGRVIRHRVFQSKATEATVLTQITQIEKSIDAAQQMIRGHVSIAFDWAILAM